MKKILCLFAMILTLALTGCGGNAVSGNYKCYNFSSSSSDGYGSEAFTLKLTGDKKFEYKQGNGIMKGNYTFKREDKNSSEGAFYAMTLNYESLTINGETEKKSGSVEWEFVKSQNQVMIINASNYSMFICKK